MSRQTVAPYLSSRALCRQIGPEAFMVNPGEPVAAVKAICARCPDLLPCRAWALDGMPKTEAVVGGMTHRERQRERRRLRREAAAAVEEAAA